MASHFLTPILLRRNNTLLVGTGARRKGRPVFFRGSAIKKKVLFGGFNGGLAAANMALMPIMPMVEPPSNNFTVEIDRVRLVKNISVTYVCGINEDATLSGTGNTILMALYIRRDGISDTALQIDTGATAYQAQSISLPTIAPGTAPAISVFRPEQDVIVWDLYSFALNDCHPRHVTTPMEIQLMRGDIIYLGFTIIQNGATDHTRSDAVLGATTAIHPDINFCYECEELM